MEHLLLDSTWTRIDASNLIGAISLAFWLCNGIPLMWEIYKRKSADGVSLGFVGLWAVGDILNLAGSLWAALVPTTIFVAIYYILSDLIIIGEAIYFQSRESSKDFPAPAEDSPLLPVSSRDETEYNFAVIMKEVLFNIGACIAVTFLGVFGWMISLQVTKSTLPTGPSVDSPIMVGPQILGYTSALLYLCARIPQIYKNYRKQRTDGLALLFFIFSVFGNLTYAASIITYSTKRDYIVMNIPWLLGSLGTLLFDFIILSQFLIYRHATLDTVQAETNLLNT